MTERFQKIIHLSEKNRHTINFLFIFLSDSTEDLGQYSTADAR